VLLRTEVYFQEGTEKASVLSGPIRDLLVTAMSEPRFNETTEVADKVKSYIGEWIKYQYFPRSFFVSLQCRLQLKGVDMEGVFSSL
jgi:hypothetical protein